MGWSPWRSGAERGQGGGGAGRWRRQEGAGRQEEVAGVGAAWGEGAAPPRAAKKRLLDPQRRLEEWAAEFVLGTRQAGGQSGAEPEAVCAPRASEPRAPAAAPGCVHAVGRSPATPGYRPSRPRGFTSLLRASVCLHFSQTPSEPWADLSSGVFRFSLCSVDNVQK